MNIAIINVLAKSRSTGKIAYGLHQFMKQKGHNAYLFYGREDEQVEPGENDIIRVGSELSVRVHGVCARIFGCEGTYSRIATYGMLKKFKELKIEAVVLFNIHGYYLNTPMLFNYLGKNGIKVIYVMLDEFPFLGKCAYSFECDKFMTECHNCKRLKDYPKTLFFDCSKKMFNLKKKEYKKVQDITFVGIEYTVDRAKKSNITKQFDFVIADEAVDLKGMYYPRDTKSLRTKLGIPSKNKVIVTITPYPAERKGGEYFVKMARQMGTYEDVSFVHVGVKQNPDNMPNNYIPIGYVKDQELLAEYYSLGDLFVVTSFAETIPAVCIEALACGTPILGFDISGIPTCADKEHGTFVAPKDVNAMVKVVKNTPIKTGAIIESCRQYANSRYDACDYYDKLTKLVEKRK